MWGRSSFSPSPRTHPGHPNPSPEPVQVAFQQLSRVPILPPRSVFCIASSHAVLSRPLCVLAFQFLEPAMGSQLQGVRTCCPFRQGCPSFPFSPGYCLPLLQVSVECPSSRAALLVCPDQIWALIPGSHSPQPLLPTCCDCAYVGVHIH